MSDRHRNEKDEDEKEHDEKEEKEQKEEKWRRDTLSGLVWGAILIWAGLVWMARNLDFWVMADLQAWPVVLLGAGVIFLLETVVRLVEPPYRRPVGGTLILGIVLVAAGLGQFARTEIVWAIVLIAVGLSFLLRSRFRREE